MKAGLSHLKWAMDCMTDGRRIQEIHKKRRPIVERTAREIHDAWGGDQIGTYAGPLVM